LQSHKFTVVGTRPLVILDVGPDDTNVKDATDAVKVTLTAEPV
jgi:hypothetical protein